MTIAFARLVRSAGRLRYVTVRGARRHAAPASIAVSGRAGRNSVPFSGRIGAHALAAGRYRVTIRPAGSPASAPALALAAFRVLTAR